MSGRAEPPLEVVVQETAIDGYLKALKMPGAKREYRDLLRQAQASGAGLLGFLEQVLSVEVDNRRQNQVAQRLREGKFPFPRELAAFDFTAAPSVSRTKIFDLAEGRFVQGRENVIFLGPSGLGKTFLGIGLCRAVIRQGYRARFTTATALMNELLSAQSRHELARCLRGFGRYDVIMVDEIGYLPFSQEGARLLFQFFSELHERRSFLLTSNLEFSRWIEVFGEATLTAALLDRLTHRAHVFALEGESYRLREARQRAGVEVAG